MPLQSFQFNLSGWTFLRKAVALGGGGGFSLAFEDFGRMFDHSFSACAFFFLSFFLSFFLFFFNFFWVDISSRALIPLFRPGSAHSGSVSWDDCGRVFPDVLRVNSFPTLCLDSGIVSPLRVKCVCVFMCNLPPALSVEWPAYFTRHCSNTGVERKPNKCQHTKLTLEKKILPLLLPGFELAIFRSRVRRSIQQAIPAKYNTVVLMLCT